MFIYVCDLDAFSCEIYDNVRKNWNQSIQTTLQILYADSKEVRSQIMFDLEKKIVDAQTSYDIGRYNSHSPIFSYIPLNKLKINVYCCN